MVTGAEADAEGIGATTTADEAGEERDVFEADVMIEPITSEPYEAVVEAKDVGRAAGGYSLCP